MTRKLFSLRISQTPAGSGRAGRSFHAVEVRCSTRGCPASQSLRGKRFLAVEAPTLPLERCNRVAHCQCQYRHFADRRQGPRRAQELGIPPPLKQRDVDERKGVGRRSSDLYGADTPSALDDTYYDYIADKRRD